MWVGPSSDPDPPRRRLRAPGGKLPRPSVDPDSVPPVPHGGAPPSGAQGAGPVDLSLSTNPYGPPPFLREALRSGLPEVTSYPDRVQSDLTALLAERTHLGTDELLIAGSASELLRCAIAAFGPRRRMLVPRYSYEEYRRVGRSVGARVVEVPMPGLRLDLGEVRERLTPGALVVLSNPGTPNGQYHPWSEMAPLLEEVSRQGALLLVDESYLPFVEGAQSLTGSHPNALVVFSWSKVLGLPGLPVGHAAGSAQVLSGLRSHVLPWSLGPFSRHLALEALKDRRWVPTTLRRVRLTAAKVRRSLGSPSRANYFMVEGRSSHRLASLLLERGFRVRDLGSMGLVRHVRFAVRDDRTTDDFLQVLAEVRVAEGHQAKD